VPQCKKTLEDYRESTHTASNFAVGNRGRAFTCVVADVARLDEGFARALVRHLDGISCGHWDRSMWDLAAQSVSALGEVAGDYIVFRYCASCFGFTIFNI
jgi:hypothetical protein